MIDRGNELSMNGGVLEHTATFLAAAKRKRTKRVLTALAGLVVLSLTTWALVLPGITMANVAFCGIQEHKHSDACYEWVLACGFEGDETEEAGDSSPDASGADDSSSSDDGSSGSVSESNSSSASDSGSASSSDDDSVSASASAELASGEGKAVVISGDDPSVDAGSASLTGSASPSESSDSPSGSAGVAATGEDSGAVMLLSSGAGNAADDTAAAAVSSDTNSGSTSGESAASPSSSSGGSASAGHVHSNVCYKRVLVCELTEHEHSLACYSDASADVETEDLWEATLPAGDDFTGNWAADVLAVAQSQLGYTESSANYEVDTNASGVEITKGYTRYGAWYGDAYGDWCAMFASFCLYYAGVPEEIVPMDANCQNWIEALSAEDMWLWRPVETTENGEGALVRKGVATVPAQAAAELDAEESGEVAALADGESAAVAELAAGVQDEGETSVENDSAEGGENDQYSPAVTDASSNADARFTASGNRVYDPKPGDLVFFDWNADNVADHVGFVCELIDAEGNVVAKAVADDSDAGENVEETDEGKVSVGAAAVAGEPTKIRTIEGNASDGSADVVRYKEYDLVDSSIMGYAELPENPGSQAVATAVTSDFKFDAPTVAESASTKDFIELNLYDYNGYINDRYDSDKKYPGFQWNGGAYMYSNTFNRHSVDYIDFGNSNITDRSYGESGTVVTNGKSANAVIAGVLYNNGSQNSTGAINWLWRNGTDDTTITNRPVGMSTMTSSALSRSLGSDGYPALADGVSLSYLFTDDNYSVFKQNTESIDGLFQRNDVTGAYYYNSRENHAQYSNNTFTLYNQIITPNFIVYPFGNFLPFNTITDSTKATQVGQIASVGTYAQKIINDLVRSSDYNESPTKKQLVDMLAKYRTDLQNVSTSGGSAWDTWTAKQAISDYLTGSKATSDDRLTDTLLSKMYNIDWDEETNFFFGMDMTMNFMQPKDGLTGNDGKQPMVFYFTGDDDVWVYIDGVLFLDLTGIHRHVGGKIDFVNGEVHYYALDTEHGGDVSDEPYKTYTFAELLTAAGKSTDGLNEKGTFKDYSTHQFKFYYMERGSGSSVCRMNFNFPLLKKNSISVSKEVNAGGVEVLGNPDYKFQILKADSDKSKTNELFIGAGVAYTIYDANDEKISAGKTDAHGVFTLKAGQRAEFTGIAENAGKYYVRELVDSLSTGLGQYGEVTVSGEATTTTSDNVTVGSETFKGVDSPVKDMSDGATKFQFVNAVKSGGGSDPEEPNGKLGSLSITKELAEYPKTRIAATFNMRVTLDGEPLPVGTAYTVTTETDSGVSGDCTVAEEGIIPLKPGETATINNILLGTKFKVEETSDSAKGYTVSYSGGDERVTTDGQSASGEIKAREPGSSASSPSVAVSVVVTNSENGASIEIPVQKTIVNNDGNAHEFVFDLLQVNDEKGTPLDNAAGGNALERETTIAFDASASKSETSNEDSSADIASIGNALADGKFILTYLEKDQALLPATYFYQITERVNDSLKDSVAFDGTKYVVEVSVDKEINAGGDGGNGAGTVGDLSAKVVAVYKNGARVWPVGEGDSPTLDKGDITFSNTLIGNLEVSKSVVGTATDQDFVFEIALDKGSSGVESLPEFFDAKIYRKDSSSAEGVTLKLVNGKLIHFSGASGSDGESGDGGSSIGDAGIIAGKGMNAGDANSGEDDDSRSDVSPITLKDGERIVVEGIPYGTTWMVTETNANGFDVSHEVTVAGSSVASSGESAESGVADEDEAGASAVGGDADSSGADDSSVSADNASSDANKIASGSIAVGTTKVAFTNTQLYQLPETGGVGTVVCALAGLALVGAALVGLRLIRRRKGVG